MPTDPVRNMPRRYVLGISLVVIGTVLGVTAWGGPSGPVVDESTTFPATQQIDRIEIAIGSGTIEIVSGDEVRVDVTGRARGRTSVAKYDVTDGLLRVTAGCPWFALFRDCRTPMTVVVPSGTSVTAATEAGGITASGVTAGADLRTDAGPIDVRDVAGAIHLSSNAGSISGTVLQGTVEADTSAGALTLTVIEDVTRLSATAEAGSIELIVPDAPYHVDASTSLGRTDVDVTTTDPDTSRVIEARSELGDVTIRTQPDPER